MRVLAVFLLAAAAAAPAHARPGDLDRGFASGGRTAYKVWGTGGSTTGLTLVDGVRPLLSVNAWRGLDRGPAWLQLTAGGRLAARTAIPTTVGYAPILASGYALTPLAPLEERKPADPLPYRLERIGSAQPVTLTMPGADVVSAVGFGVDGAGRVVVICEAIRHDRYHGFVARFLPTGELDAGFGAGGRVDLPGNLGEIVVKPDGRVFLIDFRRWLTALDAAGKPLRGFAQGHVPRPGKRGYFHVDAFIEGPSGTFLIAGSGEDGAWLARLRPSGRVDERFGDDGYVVRRKLFGNFTFNALARGRRGRLVVGGAFFRDTGENPYQAAVLRFSARGRLDRTFANRGRKIFLLGRVPGVTVSGSSIDAVELDRRGRIVVAGESFDEDFGIREDTGNPYPAIARLRG